MPEPDQSLQVDEGLTSQPSVGAAATAPSAEAHISEVASERSDGFGDLLPDEIPFSLTRMEYRVLCTGEMNESKASRNVFIGLLASAVIGLAAVVTSVDWAAAFHQVRVLPFLWAALLFAVVVCSACCTAIQHRHWMRDNRPYYALMARLRQYFEEDQTSQF